MRADAPPLTRLTSLWSGLPQCSVIAFRHLQKTGGTSVVKLFEDLQRDLQFSVAGYWTPCWRGRSVHVAQGRLRWLRGLRKIAELANGSSIAPKDLQLLDTPPWRARMLLHIHHPDSVECGGLEALQRELGRLRPYAPSLSCNIVVCMLVRDPMRFFVSWWYYIGAKRCGDCSFVRYLQLNPNAQSHMVIGGRGRVYTEALLQRHQNRDPALKEQLAASLKGIDLLGPTERLDEFVYVLCEKAGLRTCPRPGQANVRNEAAARGTRRNVERRVEGSRQGGLSSAPDAAAAAPVSDEDDGMILPNASSPSQRKAVESAGWLDRWLYEEAGRSLDNALQVGGPVVAWGRRRRMQKWKALPMDKSSGCLQFGDASREEANSLFEQAVSDYSTLGGEDAEARMSKGHPSALVTPATFRVGAGGSAESTGLRMTAPWVASGVQRKASKNPVAAAAAAAEAARCWAVRSEVARRGSEGIPDVLRPVLLNTTSSSTSRRTRRGREARSFGSFAAMCSTRVRLEGVKRGCHID